MTMRDQYDKLTAAYTTAAETGDAEALVSLYTEEALILAPGHPPISGRQAIEEYCKASIGHGFELTLNVLDFQEQGDTAYVAGTWESGGDSGNWLEVYKRQSDDSLLVHRRCSNSH